MMNARRKSICIFFAAATVVLILLGMCVTVSIAAWSGGAASEIVSVGTVGLYYVDCPDDPTASEPTETKVVRRLSVSGDRYKNYICVSRTGANVATRAYISFSVDLKDPSETSSVISDILVTRTETDENGIPRTNRKPVTLHSSPNAVGEFEKAYILLDFKDGADQFFALDFEFSTMCDFTLIATVDDKGPETDEPGYYAVTEKTGNKRYVGYRLEENKFENIYELPFAYRVCNTYRDISCNIVRQGGNYSDLPSDIRVSGENDSLYFDAYGNEMLGGLPRYRLVVDFNDLTPATDNDEYFPTLNFRTTLFDDTSAQAMSEVNGDASEGKPLFYCNIAENSAQNIGSLTVRANTRSVNGYVRANSFDINLISLRSDRFFDFIYNEERGLYINSLKNGSYRITERSIPLQDSNVLHSNWVGDIYDFSDKDGIQAFGVGEGNAAHGFAVIYRTSENAPRNDPDSYKSIPLEPYNNSASEDWDYSVALDTTVSGVHNELLGKDFMIYYNGNAMSQELDESVVRIKKTRSHLYHIAYRIGPPKTEYGNEDSINKARGLYFIKIRKRGYDAVLHRYNDNVNIMYSGETDSATEIHQGAAWSADYKEGYYAVGQFSKWAVHADMRLEPRMTGFGNYALKKDYIISSRTDYVYDYSYSEANGQGVKVGTDNNSKPDAYKIVRVTRDNDNKVHYDWYGAINGRITQNMGIDVNDNISVTSERIFFNVYDYNIGGAWRDDLTYGNDNTVVSSYNGYYVVGKFSDWEPNPFFKITGNSITAFDIVKNDFAALDYYNGFKIVRVTRNGNNVYKTYYPYGGNLVETSSTVSIDYSSNTVTPRRNSSRVILDARGWGYNVDYHVHAWEYGENSIFGDWNDRPLMIESDTPNVFYYDFPINKYPIGVIFTKDEKGTRTELERHQISCDNSKLGVVLEGSKSSGVTVSLSDGINVSVNGTPITPTNGKISVFYGDNISVDATVDITDGKEYGFIIDNDLTVTQIDGNIISTVFRATQDHTISYCRLYTVSGITTANASITVAKENGRKTAVADASDSGHFTVKLPNGKYFLSAETDIQVSDVLEFQVSDANIDLTTRIEPTRLKISHNVYDELPFDYVTGYYTSGFGDNYGGYFAHIEVGEQFVLGAKVNEFKGQWYSAGFIVQTDRGPVRFYFRDNGAAYDCVSWSEGYSGKVVQNKDAFINAFDAGTVDLSLIYQSGTYLFAVNGEIVSIISNTTENYGTPNGKVGLVCEHSVSFCDWHYSTDPFTDLVARKITVSGDGITLSIGEQPIELIDNVGVVKIGDTVTVTVKIPDYVEGTKYSVMLDGGLTESILTGDVLTAVITVADNHLLSYERLYEVSGTAQPNSDLTVVNDHGKREANAVATADGSFSLLLPRGKYYIGSETATRISDVTSFSVASETTGITVAVPNKLKIDSGSISMLMPYVSLALPFDFIGGVYRSGDEANYGGYFSDVTTSEKFTLSATVERFKGEWASAGFAVQTTNGFVRFYLRYNTMTGRYDSVAWNENGVPTVVSDKAAFSDLFVNSTTAQISLIYRNGAYIFAVNGMTAYTIDNFSAAYGRAGLVCERSVAYTQWSYSDGATEEPLARKLYFAQSDLVVTVNGVAVASECTVYIGDKVMVSKALSENERINIFLDGAHMQTVISGNEAYSVFTVKDDHTISYQTVFEIGGSSLPNAQVFIATASVPQYDNVFADANGHFSVYVPNGIYYVYAMTDTLISASVKASIQNNGVTVGNIIPDKPRLTESSLPNCASMYYDAITGKYKSEQNDSNGGLFAGVNILTNEAHVITADVERFDGAWYSAGFAVRSDNDIYKFVLRRNGGGFYDCVVWYPDGCGKAPDQISMPNMQLHNDPFIFDGYAKLALAYNNGTWYVFVNETLVHTVSSLSTVTLSDDIIIDSTVSDDMATAPTARSMNIGLFGEQSVIYGDWGYSTDRNDVVGYIGRTITVTDMTVFVGNVQITGERKIVLLGDIVTVVDTDVSHHLYLDGVELDCMIGADDVRASFTVTDNHTVTSEAAYSVRGTTDSDAKVYIVGNGKTLIITPDDNGNFAAILTRGEYYLRAETDTRVSEVVKIIVSALDITLTEPLIPDKLKLDMEKVGDYSSLTFDDSDGYYKSGDDVRYGAFFKGANASENANFAVTISVGNLSEVDWASVGIMIGTADRHMRFVLRRTDYGYFDTVLFKVSGDRAPQIENEALRADPFANGTLQIKLEYNSVTGIYSFYLNDTKIFDTNGTVDEKVNAGGDIRVGLFCERKVTYIDWSVDR